MHSIAWCLVKNRTEIIIPTISETKKMAIIRAKELLVITQSWVVGLSGTEQFEKEAAVRGYHILPIKLNIQYYE